MELEKNEAGLLIMPRQLDWDYHYDDWEVRAASCFGIKYLNL
jgi:hypothetical protein